MTHKEECLCYCIDHLQSRSLNHAFDFETFSHYYRKHNGAWGNAWNVGLSAADMMIDNANNKIQEVNHDTGNEGETPTAQRA